MGVDTYLRNNSLLVSSRHVRRTPFELIRLARPRILHGLKHVFSHRNGTKDHEQPRSVPLVPMLFGGGLGCVLTPHRERWNEPNGILFAA